MCNSYLLAPLAASLRVSFLPFQSLRWSKREPSFNSVSHNWWNWLPLNNRKWRKNTRNCCSHDHSIKSHSSFFCWTLFELRWCVISTVATCLMVCRRMVFMLPVWIRFSSLDHWPRQFHQDIHFLFLYPITVSLVHQKVSRILCFHVPIFDLHFLLHHRLISMSSANDLLYHFFLCSSACATCKRMFYSSNSAATTFGGNAHGSIETRSTSETHLPF